MNNLNINSDIVQKATEIEVETAIKKCGNVITGLVERKMNLADALKSYCKELQSGFASTCIPTDENGYWNVNVVFINSHDNITDETQFDIKPSNFDYAQGKCSELVELWKEFCKENDFKQNSVIEIYLENCKEFL